MEEEERQRFEAEQHWLRLEAEAQKQWHELQKKLEAVHEEKERQNMIIKLEWEKEQQKLRALKEKKQRELEENERRQRKIREEIENFIAYGGSTPEYLKTTIEMNPNKPTCPFFQKTAACRFRDSCSRNHIKPCVSRILLIPNFYSHYSLEHSDNEHGDSYLEFENHETYSHFKEFFYDVLPEMEKYGYVKQFKVCCNRESHLRGNVYVEYASTREAVKSFQVFNGRWYGGKQLTVEFCYISSWKSAICGLHTRKKCPKGSSCNFLHVFTNPNNLFHKADGDEHRSPSPRNSKPKSITRNWRWSESPDRLPSPYPRGKKRERRRKRDCSKEKRRYRSRSRSRETHKKKGSRHR